MALQFIIQGNQGEKAWSSSQQEVNWLYEGYYEPEDEIILKGILAPSYVWVQVDEVLGESLIYATQSSIKFRIPFNEQRACYAPKAFEGEKHILSARLAHLEEETAYRNLALNPMDQHGFEGYYPHASANVETRGEAVFAARNAIDGIRCNQSHGEWPYGSWGINQRKDATWHLDFGTEVEIDEMVLYERADFPHDSYWTEVTVRFSDGSVLQWPLIQTDQGQHLKIKPKKITGLTLEKLIKAEDPSPFPALTQFEVYGKHVSDRER